MMQTKWKTSLTCYKTCSLLIVPPVWQLAHLAQGWKAAQPNRPACLKTAELENKACFNRLQEASSISLVLAPQSNRQPHISMAAALLPAGTTCSRAGWGLRGCPPPAASLCVTSQHTFPWVQHQAQAVPEHGSLLAPQALPITKKVPRHSLGSGQNDEFGNWELQIVPLKPVGMFNVYKIRAACLWKMGP